VANHPQAEKRNRQRIKRQAHHRHFRTSMRTLVKRVRAAIEKGDRAAADEALKKAVPLVDRCGQKNVIPPKRAARIVGRLTRAVQRVSAE